MFALGVVLFPFHPNHPPLKYERLQVDVVACSLFSFLSEYCQMPVVVGYKFIALFIGGSLILSIYTSGPFLTCRFLFFALFSSGWTWKCHFSSWAEPILANDLNTFVALLAVIYLIPILDLGEMEGADDDGDWLIGKGGSSPITYMIKTADNYW